MVSAVSVARCPLRPRRRCCSRAAARPAGRRPRRRPPSDEDPAARFRATTPSAAARVRRQGPRRTRRSYPIAVHDVSFTSNGKKVEAFLLVPPGQGEAAGGRLRARLGRRPHPAARARPPGSRRATSSTLTLTEPSTANPPRALRLAARSSSGRPATCRSPTSSPSAARSTCCGSGPRSTPTGSATSAGARARRRARSSPRPSRT